MFFLTTYRDSVQTVKQQTDTDRQTDRQTDGQTDRQTGRQTDRPTDRQTDRHTDGQTYGQTDGQTYGQTDRQTDRRRDIPGYRVACTRLKNIVSFTSSDVLVRICKIILLFKTYCWGCATNAVGGLRGLFSHFGYVVWKQTIQKLQW